MPKKQAKPTRPTCPGGGGAAPPMCHTAFKEQVKVCTLDTGQVIMDIGPRNQSPSKP
jgi:hypothetical protein